MGGPERKSQATGRRMDVWVRGLPRTSVLASVLCELSTARPQGSENVPEPDTSAGTRRQTDRCSALSAARTLYPLVR